MAVSAFWTSQDLLHELCHTIRQRINVIQARSDLARLALCSKFISKIALDELWRYPKSIDDLLRLLDCTEDNGYSEANLSNPDSLELYRVYSRRIRNIDIRYPAYPVELLQHISQSTNCTPLIPNLRELVWMGDAATFASISFFLGPWLRLFRIIAIEEDAPADDADTAALLDALHASCPRLPTLELHVPFLTNTVAHKLHRFGDLHSLSILAATVRIPNVMAIVLALQGLRVFNVFAGSPNDNGDVREIIATSAGVGLAVLRSLNLDGSWDNMDAVLGALPTTHLERVLVEYGLDEDAIVEDIPERYRTVMMQLCTRFGHTLRSVSLMQAGIPPDEDSDSDDFPFFEHLLSPLVELKRLEELKIDIPALDNVRLDDAQIHAALPNWPHLRIFSLDLGFFGGAELSPQTLCFFAQYCPSLEELELPISLHVATSSEPASTPLPHAHALKVLHIAPRSRDELPTRTPSECSVARERHFAGFMRLARMINTLFPHLHELETLDTKGEMWWDLSELCANDRALRQSGAVHPAVW